MSANQLAVLIAVIWFIWTVIHLRRENVSWVPIVPVLAIVGLNAALLLNHYFSPAGTILVAAALIVPAISTVQLVFARAKK